MNYEKLGLAKGDHWGAKHVAHIDEGIAQLYEAIDNTATDAKFFDIDYDGIVSLNAGHIAELPEKIVFPEVINGTVVTGFKDEMFKNNDTVKEIVFPSTVSDIPNSFCDTARYLHTISNTEHIRKIGERAFYSTRISKAMFPRLKEMGIRSFANCKLLHTTDIGNEVTTIPNRCFFGCSSLFNVKGGEKVSVVEERAFVNTFSLKNLSFLPNLTSVASYAFFGSRLQFDWSEIKSALGSSTYPTPVSDNEGSDYWSGCTFTECGHTLNTLMNQRNPEWANDYWGDKWYQKSESEQRKYASWGCTAISIIHIHSIFSGKVYTNPNDFEDELYAIDPTLLDVKLGIGDNVANVFKALGYSVDKRTSAITKEDYQDMLVALARGACVYVSQSTTSDVNGGHGVVIYGVNSIGEMLVLDSDSGYDYIDIYDDGFTYQLPFQNFTGPSSDFIIVEKKQAEE